MSIIFKPSFFNFSKYAVVGILTLLIYLIFTFLIERIFEANIIASSSGAFCVAIVFNYLSHYYWTYNTQQEHKLAAAMYMITVSLGLFYNFIIIQVCDDLFNMGEYFGVVIFSLSWPLISYIIMRINVFKHKAE